jgi:hypothetical protein
MSSIASVGMVFSLFGSNRSLCLCR